MTITLDDSSRDRSLMGNEEEVASGGVRRVCRTGAGQDLMRVPCRVFKGRSHRDSGKLQRLPVLEALDFTNKMLLWEAEVSSSLRALGWDGGHVHPSSFPL